MPDNEAKKLKGEENSVDDSSRNDWLLYPTRTRYISRCDWMEREYRTSKSNSNHLYRARNKNRDEVSRRGYRMPLVLPIFLSPPLFYSRSPSPEASCHRGQCDTSPFRAWLRGCTVVIHGTMPIQSLYRHENVPIEQWPPTLLCYRASDRKEFRRDEKFDRPAVIVFKILKGVDWWKFLFYILDKEMRYYNIVVVDRLINSVKLIKRKQEIFNVYIMHL